MVITHRWFTENAHFDNTETMNDYLNFEMDPSWEVVDVDGTSASVISDTGAIYELHASGDGDSFNHKVEIIKL